MRVEITQLVARFPKGYFIQWALFDATEGGSYEVTVERAGGPEGPWATVLAATSDQYAVLDELNQQPATLTYLPPNQLTTSERVTYRVRVKAPSGREFECVKEADAFRANATPGALKLLQHKRHLQMEFHKSLRYLGTEVLLFKRRRWGTRCPRCYDARTNKVMRADCRACWGVGFEGGYWSPVSTQAVRSSLNSTATPTQDKKAEGVSADIILPEYPLVEPDDLLICLEDQRRFLLQSQKQPEIRLRGVFQLIDAIELARDHVLFGIPVQPVTTPPLF